MQARLSLYASLVVLSARTTHQFFFNNILLPYSKNITHLGHILSENVKRVLKDLKCKANSILCTFHCADPVVADSIFLPIFLWWYTMEAQHKWNQSSGSRLIVHIVAQVNTVKIPSISYFSQKYPFLSLSSC